MSPTLSVMATNAGVILGTAGYMSPEQAREHPADQSALVARWKRALLYLTPGQTGRIMSVDVQTQHGFSFGKVKALPIEGIVNSVDRSYDVAPDGKHFLVLVPNLQTMAANAPAEQINVTLNWFAELKQRVPAK